MKFKHLTTLVLFIGILFSSFYFAKGSIFLKQKCKNITDKSSKMQCWKDSIDRYLSQGKLSEGMDLVAFFYEEDPDFSTNCHDFVHLIGKDAYKLFAEGKKFDVSPKSSYCSYGFYHGFMESLVSQKGDVAQARSFCNYIDSELSKVTPSANLACYHGIGHGWANIHDEKLWGNERAIVYPALDLCEKVTIDPEELKICATGVFDSISIGYYNKINGLKINEKDPFWLCREQKEKYKTACYMDLSPAILWLGGDKLSTSLKYTKGVEKEYLELEIETIAENSARFLVNDSQGLSEAVDTCRSLSKTLYESCIKGLSSGFLQFGNPGKEYEQAINFCGSRVLNKTEKDICLNKVLTNLSSSVTPELYKEICSSTGEYQKFCLN